MNTRLHTRQRSESGNRPVARLTLDNQRFAVEPIPAAASAMAPEGLQDLEIQLVGVASRADDVTSSLAALRDRLVMIVGGDSPGQTADYASLLVQLEVIGASVADQNQRASESTRALLGEMQRLAEEIEALHTVFRRLHGQIDNVRTFSEQIRAISRETSLMGINAMCEAMRAGEHGRGFAVVAAHVNELAQRSAEHTEKIQDVTETLLHDTHVVADAVTGLFERVRVSANVLGDVSKEGERLNEEIDKFPAIIGSIEERLSKDEMLGKARYDLDMATLASRSIQSGSEICLELVEAQLRAFRSPSDPSAASLEASLCQMLATRNDRGFLSVLREELDRGQSAVSLLRILSLIAEKAGKQQKALRLPLTEIFLNGRMLHRAMRLLMPRIDRSRVGGRGTVVLGNAFGDYHALGREMMSVFLQAAGFRVVDLGLGVPSEVFVETAIEERADVVGVSTLLLHTAPEVRKIRDGLRQRRKRIPVLIGGAPFVIDQELHHHYNVDFVARGVSDGLAIVTDVCKGRGR